MRKLVRLGIAFVVVLLCGVVISTIYSHLGGGAATSAMSATTVFLGYTNDPTQGRLAIFRFSNTSPVRIQRHYFYAVDFQTATGWVAQGTRSFPQEGPRSFAWNRYGPALRPGESEVLVVPAPLTQTCWRIGFPYVQPENKALRIAAEEVPSLHEHGLLTNYADPYADKYWSYSDKIDP
jgi:hypothetical protein